MTGRVSVSSASDSQLEESFAAIPHVKNETITARGRSQAYQVLSNRRRRWGNALIRFCGFALVLTSAVKFVHPPKAVAYMASMGFEGSTFFLVASLELLSAVLFLVPATRAVGLLLVASYLGGAMAAHLAVHRFFAGGPFLVYMAMHPYIGSLVPAGLLAIGCVGFWLSHPEVLSNLTE